MTNKEILYKSIKKAVINGYLKPGVTTYFYQPLDKTCKNEACWYLESISFYQVIFSHNFAKAFFEGEEYGWKVQLERMVGEKEPLKYLEKFLC